MQGIRRSKGILFVISGPSGVGKNSVLTSLLKGNLELCYSISATTRSPRKGEEDSVNYFFMTRQEFLEKADKGDFFEYQEYVGNLYGTPKDYIERMVSEGRDVVMDIECKGASEIKRKMPEAVLVFLVPPSIAELKKRLVSRSTETTEAIENRIRKAELEMEDLPLYDYYVLNDTLESAVEMTRSIITAERLRVSRLNSICDGPSDML